MPHSVQIFAVIEAPRRSVSQWLRRLREQGAAMISMQQAASLDKAATVSLAKTTSGSAPSHDLAIGTKRNRLVHTRRRTTFAGGVVRPRSIVVQESTRSNLG